MNQRIQKSLDRLVAQAAQAEKLVNEAKQKVAGLDLEFSKIKLNQLKEAGVVELERLRARLQDRAVHLSSEMGQAADRLKSESFKVKAQVQESLQLLQEQLATLAEKERQKRRARRRS